MGKKKKVRKARRVILKLLVIVILGMCATNYLINKAKGFSFSKYRILTRIHRRRKIYDKGVC